MMGHPICSRPSWKNLCVPFLIHGDGIACPQCGRAGSKSFNVWSMQGLLAIGPTLLIKHYLFGVFKQTQCPETMVHAMKILTWSLKALLAGKWPRLDWNDVPFAPGAAEAALASDNRDIADGLFGVLFGVTGDLKFMHEDMRLRCVTAVDPCEWCPCHRDQTRSLQCHVFNFAMGSLWKTALFSVADWIAVSHGRHELFLAFDFLTH